MDNPDEHLPDHVALREGADRQRKALRKLDGYLEVLEAVLTNRITWTKGHADD